MEDLSTFTSKLAFIVLVKWLVYILLISYYFYLIIPKHILRRPNPQSGLTMVSFCSWHHIHPVQEIQAIWYRRYCLELTKLRDKTNDVAMKELASSLLKVFFHDFAMCCLKHSLGEADPLYLARSFYMGITFVKCPSCVLYDLGKALPLPCKQL